MRVHSFFVFVAGMYYGFFSVEQRGVMGSPANCLGWDPISCLSCLSLQQVLHTKHYSWLSAETVTGSTVAAPGHAQKKGKDLCAATCGTTSPLEVLQVVAPAESALDKSCRRRDRSRSPKRSKSNKRSESPVPRFKRRERKSGVCTGMALASMSTRPEFLFPMKGPKHCHQHRLDCVGVTGVCSDAHNRISSLARPSLLSCRDAEMCPLHCRLRCATAGRCSPRSPGAPRGACCPCLDPQRTLWLLRRTSRIR